MKINFDFEFLLLRRTIVTYDRYARIKRFSPILYFSVMKKLLIISIVLVAIGLGLILYSDPVVTLATAGTPQVGGTPGSSQIFTGSNSTSPSNGSLPPDCTTQNGHTLCQFKSSSTAGGSSAEVITLVGIALSGAGLFLSAIEVVSKSVSPYQTKAVT